MLNAIDSEVKRCTGLPDAAVLNELLEYRDGSLYWKRRARHWFKTDASCKTWNTRYAGKSAGYTVHKSCPRRGEWSVTEVKIGMRSFLAHRVIYKMLTGCDPEMIDHINGDSTDNRIENLRPATNRQNQHNRKTSNRFGKGVSFANGRFIARICLDGRDVYIGAYKTAGEASAAYAAMARSEFGEYACVDRHVTITSQCQQ